MQQKTNGHHYEGRSFTQFRMRIVSVTQNELQQEQSLSNNEQENRQLNSDHQTVKINSLKIPQSNPKREATIITTNLSRRDSQYSLQRKSQERRNQSQSPIQKRRNNHHLESTDQSIRHQPTHSVKSSIRMSIQLPFSKQILSAEGFINNGEVVIKGGIVNLQYNRVDQQVNKLQHCLSQTISFLSQFDILTPNAQLNKKQIKDITASQMNRLILGFGFFKQSIPSSIIPAAQLKSIEWFLTSNCTILVAEINKIKNTYKLNTLASFYILIHILGREGKLNVKKLLSSLGNYAKTSQILKNLSQRQFQIHAEWSMKYHHFILQERLQFVKWFKRMLERKRQKLDDKLGRQGVQGMLLQVLDSHSYECYTPIPLIDNNGTKSIQYLNQTLKEIISSIGFYYYQLRYQDRRKQVTIFSAVNLLLDEMQIRFGSYPNLCSIQQLRDQLYQIYYIPLFHWYAELKSQGKQHQFTVEGSWNMLIEYFYQSKNDRQLDMRANPKQRERKLINILNALDTIPNITATLDNIVHLENKVCIFKPQGYHQLALSKQFPRLQTLELLLLLKLFQKYQFNKHKVFKRRSDSLLFDIKPQQQQQTQSQVQAVLNKQFDELINSVVSSRKTLPITLLFFYVHFNKTNPQSSKNKTETYILNVDPIHICEILNYFVRKQGQLPQLNRISQSFVNQMFGNNVTINQIRNDELFIHCFKIFQNSQVQLNNGVKSKSELFNLEMCFLQSTDIMFQKVGCEIKSLSLNREDTQGKIVQIFKKLAEEQKPTIQELQRRYYAKQYLKAEKQDIKTSDVLLQKALYEFNIKFMRKVLKIFGEKLSYTQRNKQTTKLIKDILKNIYNIIIKVSTKKLNLKTLFEQDQWKGRILRQQKLVSIISDEYRKMLIDDRVNKWVGKSDKERVFSELFLLIYDMTNCHLFMIDGDMIINRRENDPIVVLLRVRKAWSDIKSFFQHPKLNEMLNKVFPLEEKPTVEAFKTSLTYLNLILSKVILPSLSDCENFPTTKPIIQEMIGLMTTLKEKIIDPFRIDEFTTSLVLQVLYCQGKTKNSHGNDIEMQQTIFNQTTLQCFKFLDHLLQFSKIVESSNLPQSNQMLKMIPKNVFPSQIISLISQNLLLIQFLNLVNTEELFKKYKVHKKIGPLIEIYLKFSIKQRSTNKVWQQIVNEMYQKERQEIQNFVKKEVCKKFLEHKKSYMNQQRSRIQTNNMRNFFQLIPFSRLIELIKVIHRFPVQIYKDLEQQRLLSLGLLNKHHDQKLIKDIETKSRIHRLSYTGEYANLLKLECLPSIMNRNAQIMIGKQRQNRMGQLTQICENFTSFFLEQIQTMVTPLQQFTIVNKYGFDLIRELGIMEALLQCIQNYSMHIKSLIVIMKFLALNIFINDILQSRVDEVILDEANSKLDSLSIKVIKQMNEKIEDDNQIDNEEASTFLHVGFILLLPLLKRTMHIDNWMIQRNMLKYYNRVDISLKRIQQILSNNSISDIFLRLQSIQYQQQSQDKSIIIQIPQNAFVFIQLFETSTYLATKYFTQLSQSHVPNISDHRWVMMMSKKVEKQMQNRFSTIFLEPSICCTLNVFLSHYLIIFRQAYLLKRCVVEERTFCKILTHFLNVIEIYYQMLLKNLDPTEYKTQIVLQNQRIYQQLYDKIQVLKQTLMHFASLTTKSQQEQIQGRESFYSDLYIYLRKIITDYDEKRKNQKGYQRGVKFPIHKQIQNPLKFHRGYQIMTYSRLSKVVQTRKLEREHQFNKVFMMFIEGLKNLPQVKFLAEKETISGFNLMQEFLNSFIMFLQSNQKFRPSSQGLIEPFYQAFSIIDYWQVMMSKMRFEEMEIYLLAWMKIITQISIIMRKIITRMKIKLSDKQTFKQVQNQLNQSVHIFLVRILSSEVLICFADFTMRNESKDKNMIRYHQFKIIYSALIDSIKLIIDKKLINRELLEKPLYEFKHSNQMCKKAKKAKLDQSNLIGLIEINIIKPMVKLIATDHTQIHIQQDHKPSLDRFDVQAIVESQKIIMNVNKEGYHDMTHLVGSEMSFFKFVDCLTTLEIGEKFINTIKKIINIVKKQHSFLEHLAMNSNHIKRILKNAKIFFCTFSNPPLDIKMEKAQFKEFIKSTELKLVQIITTLRRFVYNNTQMRVQVNCFLFNEHKSMKIKNISKISRSIVKALSTYWEINESQNREFLHGESRFFTEIYDYLMADDIRKRQVKAERRKEERFKNFVKNHRMQFD